MANWELYAEADKRGILPPEKKSLYDEAKRRGLIESAQSYNPASELTAGFEIPKEESKQSYIDMEYPEVLGPSSALKQLHWVGKQVAGGTLRAVRGAAGLPFDLAAYFGIEKADKIASTIRENIPQVKAEGIVENVSQTIVQYGLPCTMAIKLANGILQGSSMAIRFVGGLMAGGLGDFIAANPEEGTVADTVADIIPDKYKLLPTSTREGESTWIRKEKIATEGVYISIPAIGAAKVVEAGAKMIRTIFSPGKSVRKAVANALQDQAMDIPSALAEIDRNLIREIEGFKPTLGTASGDPGLIGIEKYSAQEAAMLARKELNMKAISDELEKVTKQMGGDGQRAKQFFEDYITAQIEGKKNVLDIAEQAWKRVEDETTNLIHDFSYGKGKQAEASLILDDTIRKELDSLTAKKNELFKNIDPTNEVVIEKDNIRTAFSELVRKTSPLDATPSKIPADLKQRIQNILKQPEKGKEEIELTFGALQDLRPELSEAIATARKADQGGVVERLTEFKKAVEYETDILAASNHPAAESANEALSFYKNEFVPKFKKGIGDTFRKAERKGQPIPGTATAGKFLFRPTGSTEAAGQLKNIVTGPESEGAIRDYIIGTVADQMVNIKDGKVALNRLNNFLNQRPVRETLSQFPDLKNEITFFKDNLSRGVESGSLFEQQIKLRKTELAKTEKEMAKSSAKFFVDRDPANAIGAALRSGDPEKNVKELVMLANQDTTGEALKGLRKALGDHIEESVRGTTEIGGELEVLRGKVVKLLSNNDTARALSKLYNPAELKIIKDVVDSLQMMNRLNKQVTGGSPTAPIQEAITKTRIVLASMYGIVKGRGIFAISGWLAKAFNRDPVELSKQLLKDAMLDPELGKTLLMLDTKRNEKIIKNRIGSYVVNNLLTPENVESRETK